MTVLEALAILEAATLECKKRNVDTPEVHERFDPFRAARSTGMAGSTISPPRAESPRRSDIRKRGSTTSASPFFRGHQDSVRDLLGKRMDALAREFHETHDLKIKEEIDRLAAELVKLDKPWVFVAK